jgi:hypothetical protein
MPLPQCIVVDDEHQPALPRSVVEPCRLKPLGTTGKHPLPSLSTSNPDMAVQPGGERPSPGRVQPDDDGRDRHGKHVRPHGETGEAKIGNSAMTTAFAAP